MKKVIEGKVYNTLTAEHIADNDNGCSIRDFHYCYEILYRTKKGNWFLYGEGGAMSKYSQPVGNNSTSGSNRIYALDNEEAIRLLEQWNEVDKLEKYFPDYLEDA